MAINYEAKIGLETQSLNFYLIVLFKFANYRIQNNKCTAFVFVIRTCCVDFWESCISLLIAFLHLKKKSMTIEDKYLKNIFKNIEPM